MVNWNPSRISNLTKALKRQLRTENYLSSRIPSPGGGIFNLLRFEC